MSALTGVRFDTILFYQNFLLFLPGGTLAVMEKRGPDRAKTVLTHQYVEGIKPDAEVVRVTV